MYSEVKMPLLQQFQITTSPLLRPAFVSPMFFKASDKMAYANSVDPDQTAPSGQFT